MIIDIKSNGVLEELTGNSFSSCLIYNRLVTALTNEINQ